MYRSGVKASRDSASFDGARSLNEQELDAIGRFGEKLVALGDEVGVDPAELRARITESKHIHIFPRAADYAAAVMQKTHRSGGNRGILIPDTGILAIERRDPLDNVYGIMHEMTHDASHLHVTPHLEAATDGSVRLDVGKTSATVTAGHMHMGSARPHAATEAITDMATHRAMVDASLPRIIPGYGVASLLLTGVIIDTAGAREHPREVEDSIIKGILTPDQTGIGKIQKALGDQAVKIFMNTPGNLKSASTAMYANQIGSPTAEATLWARHAGAPVGWFTWR
jgi:hypothetical protein